MNTVITFFGILGAVLLSAVVMAFPVMWLWNWLMPTLFGLKGIGVLQSFGLILLIGILFNNPYRRQQ